MAARLRRTAISGVIAPVLVVLALMPLMGCTNYIFRQFDVDRGQSLSIDAKQRVVLVTHKGGKTGDRTIVCAEPSPDALSAQAASGNASGNVNLPAGTPGGPSQGSGSGSAAWASSEAAASIAMRSQTVQLLRDGLFRACEAYLNGAIDQHQYNVALLNIDKLMVTLMGVDAIGGTHVAPAVTLAAGANAQAGGAGAASNGQAGAKDVQAEAIANILLSSNAHSSTPALCMSLLASGELRLDNPGQYALLQRCDALLAGTMHNLVNRPQMPAPQYKVSFPARAAAAPANAPVAAAPATAPDATASARAASKVAGWVTRVDAPSSSWTATVDAEPVRKAAAGVPSTAVSAPATTNAWATSVQR